MTQPDTLVPNPANPQSWNRYGYVRNNPIKFNDPTGNLEEGSCSLIDDDCDPPHPITGKPVPRRNGNKNNDSESDKSHPVEATSVGCSYTDNYACHTNVLWQFHNPDTYLYSPDYLSLAFGFSIPGLSSLIGGIQIGLILDRFGNIYFYGGGSLGPEAPGSGASVSLQGGFIGPNIGVNKPKYAASPGEQRLESMLKGWFANANFYPIIGGGAVSGDDENMFSELGIGTIQLSGGGGYSFFLYDVNGNSGKPIW